MDSTDDEDEVLLALAEAVGGCFYVSMWICGCVDLWVWVWVDLCVCRGGEGLW